MIPDDVVAQVREGADIVQVVGEYVSLKRTGSDFRGPCPFHQGAHRNFSVSPKRAMYYCFVCHEGGDVFDFVRKHLGLDFVEAVKHVAARAGIEVREVHAQRGERDASAPLREAVAAAAAFFQTQLWDETEGRAAREYLDSRQVSREVAERFGLGYAPRDPARLREHLTALGLSGELLLEAGVLARREESDDLRPRFRHRLIFPILDAGGNPVGFGGRLLGPGEPRYLNSPESPIFSKARLLYGLSWAKHGMRREGRALVVEGFFDVVRLTAAGLDWTVAPLGTALTEGQATLLRRYATRAMLLFDSDAAGLRATFRAGDELLRRGIAVQVVTLPEGEDPDTFVARHGAPALASQIAAAVDVFERKIQVLARGGYFADVVKRRRAIDKLLPTIRATEDLLLRDLYITRASEAAGLTREALLNWMSPEAPRDTPPHGGERRSGDAPGAQRGATRGAPGGAPARRGTGPAPRRDAGEFRERHLLACLLVRPDLTGRTSEWVGAADFENPACAEVYAALRDGDQSRSLDELSMLLSPAAVAVVEESRALGASIADPERVLTDSIAALRRRVLDGRRDHLRREARRLRSTDPAASDAAQLEADAIAAELRALGGVRFRIAPPTSHPPRT